MKPLQGNLDFFLIRASRGPFRLKHKTQDPSHKHIPKGKLLLRCLWKDLRRNSKEDFVIHEKCVCVSVCALSRSVVSDSL